MENLERFISYLCGEFDNRQQIKKLEQEGIENVPFAKHVNHICNNKIANLPPDFDGFFLLEESYYQEGNRQTTLPHLFLFTCNEEEKVVLTSYELPKNMKKEEFYYDNLDLKLDYTTLEKSERFEPMIYEYINDGYEGVSISNFTKELVFTLKERVEIDTLYVEETFEKNGVKTFGVEGGIVYRRIE